MNSLHKNKKNRKSISPNSTYPLSCNRIQIDYIRIGLLITTYTYAFQTVNATNGLNVLI